MNDRKSYSKEQENIASHVLTHFGKLYVKALSHNDPFVSGTSFGEFKDVIGDILYSQIDPDPDEDRYLPVPDVTKIIRELTTELSSLEKKIADTQIEKKHRIPNAIKDIFEEMKATKEYLSKFREFLKNFEEEEGEVEEDSNEEELTRQFRFLFKQVRDSVQKERTDLLEFVEDIETGEEEEEEEEEEEGEEEEEEEEDDEKESSSEEEETETPKKISSEEEESEDDEDVYETSDKIQYVTPKKQGTKSSGLTGKLFKKLGLIRKSKSPSLVSPKEKKSKWWKKKKQKSNNNNNNIEDSKEILDEIDLMNDMVSQEFGDDSTSEKEEDEIDENSDEEASTKGNPKNEKSLKRYKRVKSLIKKTFKEYIKKDELVKAFFEAEGLRSDAHTARITLTNELCTSQKTFKELGGRGCVIVKRKRKVVSEKTSIRYDATILSEIESCVLHCGRAKNEKEEKKEELMIHKPLQVFISKSKGKANDKESVYYVYNDMSLTGFRYFPNPTTPSRKLYWEYMIDLITFVEYLHKNIRSPHLDLRPSNCLYVRDFTGDEFSMKVMTFGTTGESEDSQKSLFPSYASPERKKSFESDIYSFGLFLLFKGMERKIQNKRYTDDFVLDPMSIMLEKVVEVKNYKKKKEKEKEEEEPKKEIRGMRGLVKRITPVDYKNDVEYQRRIAILTIVVCCTEGDIRFRPTPYQLKKYMITKRYLFEEDKNEK